MSLHSVIGDRLSGSGAYLQMLCRALDGMAQSMDTCRRAAWPVQTAVVPHWVPLVLYGSMKGTKVDLSACLSVTRVQSGQTDRHLGHGALQSQHYRMAVTHIVWPVTTQNDGSTPLTLANHKTFSCLINPI